MFSRLFFALSSLFASEVVHAEPTQFLLVRHGETDWNREARYQGQVDIPLNEAGIAQAQALSERLIQEHPDISAIYSSDLSRAYVTALQSAEKYRLPVITSPALREMNFGNLEGLQAHEEPAVAAKKREADLKATVSDRKQRWNDQMAPGAETCNILVARVREQLSKIAADHPGEKVLVFAHGKAIRSLVADIEDDESVVDFIGNCSIIYVTFDPEKPENPFCFHRVEHAPAGFVD